MDPATPGTFLDAAEHKIATKMAYALASDFAGLSTEEIMASVPTVDDTIRRGQNTPAPSAQFSTWVTGSCTLLQASAQWRAAANLS